MSEVREIVTRAVLAKGRKTFRICETITPDNPPYSVLGCWVINHEFEATQNEKQVELFGNFEINIWYAYDNNTQTEIARAKTTYQGVIKVRDIVCDATTDHKDVIVRIFDLYYNGYSYQKISNLFNEEKVLGKDNLRDSTILKLAKF